MFSRSKKYNSSPEELKNYLDNLKYDQWWIAFVDNDYPYDLYEWKPVTTTHKIAWYKNNVNSVVLLELINSMSYLWYFVMKNPPDKQSVKEINHFHFIKIINHV